MFDTLVEARISELFEESPNAPGTLLNSEDETIEYKKSFSFDNQLMKTCAAFANCRGGYIVFGVENGTRKLIGLTKKQARFFDEYDLAIATQKLNSKFAPRITIRKRLHTVEERLFGVLYVYESEEKPVIATTDGGNVIREADVYFSYGARRERIKYGDLRGLLDQVIQAKVAHLFKHVEMIARIGVENAAIMDSVSGDVSGPSISNFIISKELVDKLKFVKEGEFSETAGAPTLKLVGKLHTGTDDTSTEVKTRITEDDLYYEFLRQRSVDSPRLYIEECCDQRSAYFPIYFYARQAGLDKTLLREAVDHVTNAKQYMRNQILKRIDDDNKLPAKLQPTATEAYRKRNNYRQDLVAAKKINVKIKQAKYLIYAIRTLSREDIVKDYAFELLTELYELRLKLNSNEWSDLRKAICHVDYMLYGFNH